MINRPNDHLGQELEKEAFQSINLAADLLSKKSAHLGLMMCFRQHKDQQEFAVVYPPVKMQRSKHGVA